MTSKTTQSTAGRIGFLRKGRSLNFYVGDETVEKAMRVGNGNRSEGLRIMVEAFDESTLDYPDEKPEKSKRRIRPAVPSEALGRPPEMKNGRAVNFTVGVDHLEKIKRIGNGQQSAGVRIAVEAFEETPDEQPH